MPKNIVIFSDGTGQAGGLIPDEKRSNVYKLYRASRCCPDSKVDPGQQLAFYDAGLGSAPDDDHVRTGWGRAIYKIISQATGLGITQNIIDCYAAIIRMWEPGDRIVLFGFSRGAYTARCVGGVLSLCGVPTEEDGLPIRRDPKTARRIARKAVIGVYKHGAGIKRGREKFKSQRLELAARFRERYRSNDRNGQSNAVPYFIGVWDTVAALGASASRQAAAAVIGLLGVGLASTAVWALADLFGVKVGLGAWLGSTFAITLGAGIAAYLATHVKWTTGLSIPWWRTLHVTGFKMEFYDTNLDPRVEFAKHALAIDENRLAFARVPWTDHGQGRGAKGEDWFEQIWFAGNHSDVGGSYPENESRLSDIALGWIVEKATKLPHPLVVDRQFLNLYPAASGIQHDERKSGRVPWKEGLRRIPPDAPLHETVILRLKHPAVVHFDETKAYRPAPLKNHERAAEFFTTSEEMREAAE